ncbi:MAG: glycosyltransferase family 4 protein [Chitinophagaceae bacterium]|nr:glycosyltransferase family 4 protein [Chitinophagaceae bacterium]
MKQKILIHSLVFSPDGVSTAYLYNDIAVGFKQANYEVVVLTTTPHYNVIENLREKQPLVKKYFGLYFESNFQDIRVIHVPLKKYKNTLIRICSFIYWHIISFFLGLSLGKINYILSPSPPLSIGLVSILIAKLKGAKFIYNVQEIYPDLLIKKGGLNSALIIKALKWLEKFVYNNSDSVITIDPLFYNQIIDRFKNRNKLKIISNFVDTDLYKPVFDTSKLPDQFLNSSDKVILMYAGNIGFYQDWEPVLYAAQKLCDANIEFWIIGEGVQKDYLISVVQDLNLNNIKIFPYQEREMIPYLNSHADIHFISIRQEMEEEGFPSKVYTIMACAKPMIVLTGQNTPLYNFLNKFDCSLLITKNRNENFVKSIELLAKDKNQQYYLGQNGYKTVQENYTKSKVVGKYINLVAAL